MTSLVELEPLLGLVRLCVDVVPNGYIASLVGGSYAIAQCGNYLKSYLSSLVGT